MNIRELAPVDTGSIREIALNSLEASYSDILGRETIETALEEWYSEEALMEYLESDDMAFLVAVDDGEVIGFSQSYVLEDADTARIVWLHVDPEHRGKGVGTKLFERTRKVLDDRGIDRVTGLVIENNEQGNRFYANRGFEQLYDRTITIAGAEYTENVYGEPGTQPNTLEAKVISGAHEVWIDFEESNRGSEGPFYAAYQDPDQTRRYGWFCSHCESLDNTMDPMGRIKCNQCPNRRRATRWDAGYL